MSRIGYYYNLKQQLEQKEKDLQTAEYEYNAIVNQEPYMAGRMKGRQHLIHKLKGEINSLRKELNQMMNKDTAEILRLSGFTVDACSTEDDDATKGGAIEQYGKDGGPGSGIKGHTTPKKSSSYYAHKSQAQQRLLDDIDEIKSEFKGKKLTHGMLLQKLGDYGWEDYELEGLKLPLNLDSKDSCGEKVYTKGTDDACTKDEKEQWITINGAPVKIEEGQSKGEAAKKFIAKKKGKEETPSEYETLKNNPEKMHPAYKAAYENYAKPKEEAKPKGEKKEDDKARKKWAKTLAEEYELSSPKDIRKNMEEDGEVDEEYLSNYTKQYDIILDHPVGSKVLIGGKEREITDYIPDDDGEDIMAELDGDDWVSVMKLKKSSSKDADPKVAEAEAIINLCGGVR